MNIQYIIFCIIFSLYIVFFTKNKENKIVSIIFFIELFCLYYPFSKFDSIGFLIVVSISNFIIFFILKKVITKNTELNNL